MTTPTDPASAEHPVALITGGARRVGRSVCLRLAAAGYDIALTYRESADEAWQVVREVEQRGRRAAAFQIDLAEADVDKRLHDALTARFDRLDALVNNAAIFSPTPLGELDAAEYDRFQAVNARAPLMLMQRFAPMLAAHFDENTPASTGRIVNFADIHVLGEPTPGYAAYNASKAALLELTQTAAIDLAPAVTVNAIAPGVVAWASDLSEDYRKRYLARTPLGRTGTPDDAAEAVRWLICDAHYCTGQVIRVDGGRFLR